MRLRRAVSDNMIIKRKKDLDSLLDHFCSLRTTRIICDQHETIFDSMTPDVEPEIR